MSLLFRAVLCAALVLLGATHQMHSAPSVMLDPAARDFLSAGGDPSDLCTAQDGETSIPAGCPVCTLCAAFDLPVARGDLLLSAFRVTYADWGSLLAQIASHRSVYARSPRAPPLLTSV